MRVLLLLLLAVTVGAPLWAPCAAMAAPAPETTPCGHPVAPADEAPAAPGACCLSPALLASPPALLLVAAAGPEIIPALLHDAPVSRRSKGTTPPKRPPARGLRFRVMRN